MRNKFFLGFQEGFLQNRFKYLSLYYKGYYVKIQDLLSIVNFIPITTVKYLYIRKSGNIVEQFIEIRETLYIKDLLV